MNQALVLDRNAFLHLQGPQRLRVTRGTLWLTIDRDPDDHLLASGQALDVPAGAHALVQALGAPARACVRRPDRWWQRVARAVHRAGTGPEQRA
jgi:hypothetical protein